MKNYKLTKIDIYEERSTIDLLYMYSNFPHWSVTTSYLNIIKNQQLSGQSNRQSVIKLKINIISSHIQLVFL